MALTRQQLKQLASEATALANWTTVRDFAHQVYGEGKAVKIRIDTFGEYNDEGGTNFYIGNVTAYDKDGNMLAFDRSLPFFSSEAWKEAGDDEDDEDDDIGHLKNFYMLSEEDKNWLILEDLPAKDETYDLTNPPTLSFLIAHLPLAR